MTAPAAFVLDLEEDGGPLRRVRFSPCQAANLAGDLFRYLAALDPDRARLLVRELAAFLDRQAAPAPLEPLTTRHA